MTGPEFKRCDEQMIQYFFTLCDLRSLDVTGFSSGSVSIGDPVGGGVAPPVVRPRPARQRGALVVYPPALQPADQREEVLVGDGRGGDGRGRGNLRRAAAAHLRQVHAGQGAALVLDPRPLHLHQLLEERVVGETVLVRGGHAQSLYKYIKIYITF